MVAIASYAIGELPKGSSQLLPLDGVTTRVKTLIK
jgi:hypothetical protein